MNTRQHAAMNLLSAGLSIVPIRPDGSKAASVKWERYQHERATAHDVQRWFSSLRSGIGIIAGEISGGLEILDFDDGDVHQPWENLVGQIHEGILDHIPLVWTPTGGFHVYYRALGIERNQKLARRLVPGQSPEVRIETRGEGGYVLSPYCHPDCHPLRQSYVLLRGDLANIPLISADERQTFINAARAFDECIDLPPRTFRPSPYRGEGDEKPGEVYSRTHSWHEVLEPHGWKAVHHQSDTIYWKRPGKDDKGWSASTNHNGLDQFYVFTTNAYPFKENTGYKKFTVYTLLHHRGDFHAAAKALAQEQKHGRQAVAVSG
jgi:putative DNA primase/helicase